MKPRTDDYTEQSHKATSHHFEPTSGFDSVTLPEFILPSQYKDLHACKLLPPVKKLQFQVLLDGANCYLYRKGASQAEAEKWFKSRQDGPFAFDIICESFDMDPDWIWGKLKEFKNSKKSLPRRSPVLQARNQLIPAREG